MRKPIQTSNKVAQNNSLSTQRSQAKAGMAIALGTLVATGFMAHMSGKDNAGTAHTTHLVAGVALVGFSYWHWKLYQRPNSGKGPTNA